jgi:drug/metabolite transporter (DMT)-like permease
MTEKIINRAHEATDRARVVAKAAVTWIASVVAVLQYVLTQDVLMDYPTVVQYIGQAVALLGGVIAVIRRVTPVSKDERGIMTY